jgi:hypothetical protein
MIVEAFQYKNSCCGPYHISISWRTNFDFPCNLSEGFSTILHQRINNYQIYLVKYSIQYDLHFILCILIIVYSMSFFALSDCRGVGSSTSNSSIFNMLYYFRLNYISRYFISSNKWPSNCTEHNCTSYKRNRCREIW